MEETVTTPGRAAADVDEPAPVAADGRYRVIEEIARGGMGVVHRVFDATLRREIAVKVLKAAYPPDSAVGRRFFDEARIAGQLQHPGVPAVHDLGTLADGRPFLAMKLVAGRTLHDLLADRGPMTPNLVAVFEQVCQAVGYAHAHGVIHRDLKPQNVMVGAFGEVQVMDWGLAKVLEARDWAREGDPQATTPHPPIRSEGSNATEYGSMLGTPAFMPPEQAGGEWDKVDARADVFGLGGLLCVILTGQPPYTGKDADSVRLKAVRGQLDDARSRLDRCGGEPGLVELCRRCLSFDPADRPRDGSVVAEEVAALRAAADRRARDAEVKAAEAATQARELRRRRRVQLALAASLVTIIALGLIAWWWTDREAVERRNAKAGDYQRKRLHAEAALSDAYRTPGENWAAAFRHLDHAEALASELDPPDDQLNERIEKIRRSYELERDDRLLLAALADASAASSEGAGIVMADNSQLFNIDRTAAGYKKALADYGVRVGETPPAEAAAKFLSRPKRVQEEVWSMLISWRGVLATFKGDPATDQWLRDVSNAMGLQEFSGPVKAVMTEPEGPKRAAKAREVAETLPVRDIPPRVIPNLANTLGMQGFPQAAVVLLRRAQNHYPSDFWINTALAWGYPQQVTLDQRIRYAAAGVASQPNSGTARYNLLQLLMGALRWDEALHLTQWFLDRDPKAFNYLAYRAVLLEFAGRAADAERAYRRLLELDSTEPRVLSRLAALLRARGETAGADDLVERAKRHDPDHERQSLPAAMALYEVGKLREAAAMANQLRLKRPADRILEMWHARMARVAGALPNVDRLKRGDQVSLDEVSQFLVWEAARLTNHHRLAVRLATESFARDEKLALDLEAGHRVRAASSAAMVLAGKDADPKPVDETERKRLASDAYSWLTAQLAAWRLRSATADAETVRSALLPLRHDPMLAAVRDPAALDAMPAVEAKKWRTFWAEMDNFLASVPVKK